MGWLGVGRPEQPRKVSSQRETRHDQREAMRASRDSNTWGQQQLVSPAESTTGAHGHPHGERPHFGTSSSRRVSHTRTSSRGRSQQPSPLTSPRAHSNVSGQQQQQQQQQQYYQQQPSFGQHSMQQQQQQHVQQQDSAYGGGAGAGSQGGAGMLDRVRQAVQSFASGGGGSSGGAGGSGVVGASGQLRTGSKAGQQPASHQLPEAHSSTAAAEQVRELQQRMHAMEAQVNEVEQVKQKLLAEQRVAVDWKEKWNLQNFKLNVMLDMLVLQALEHEGSGGGGAHFGGNGGAVGAGGQLTSAATFGRAQQQQVMQQVVHQPAGGLVSPVGRQASSRRGEALMEEEYDG